MPVLLLYQKHGAYFGQSVPLWAICCPLWEDSMGGGYGDNSIARMHRQTLPFKCLWPRLCVSHASGLFQGSEKPVTLLPLPPHPHIIFLVNPAETCISHPLYHIFPIFEFNACDPGRVRHQGLRFRPRGWAWGCTNPSPQGLSLTKKTQRTHGIPPAMTSGYELTRMTLTSCEI